MLKFLHAADIHLDSPLRGLERYEGAPVEEIRGATRRAFENLVSLACEEEVAFVLLAGDLYDGDWRDYNTGLFFAAQMAKLEAAGIRAFLIHGNHDAASKVTKHLRLPANVKLFAHRKPETVVLDEHDVALHGQSFAHSAVTDDLAAAYPPAVPGRFNIGLLHTSLNGRPGHATYAPTTVERLRAKGYDYWALGHVHEREVVSTEPWIVFPGNLQGRHAREPGGRGATLVTVDGHRAVVEHRDLDVFRWVARTVDLSTIATPDAALAAVRDSLDDLLAADASAGRPLAVRLRLAGATFLHSLLARDPQRFREEVRAVANGFGEGQIWIEKVELATRSPVDREAAFEREDALGGLLRALRDRQTPEAPPDTPEAVDFAALGAGFAELRTRLPAELFADPEALDPGDPAQLRALLDEVRDLLLARLLASSEAALP